MDSRLDNVFRTTFRKTESADTWMGIRREENQDEPRRKKNSEEEKKEKPKWEDDTVVSIAALKQLLATLIAPDSEYQKPTPVAPKPQTLSPQQQRAHSAVHAYARQTTPPTPATTMTTADSPTLTQEENRIIHQLMSDLEILMQNDVLSLTIQKNGSFLESLSRSAKAARENII